MLEPVEINEFWRDIKEIENCWQYERDYIARHERIRNNDLA